MHGAAHVIKCAHDARGTLKIERELDLVFNINIYDMATTVCNVENCFCKIVD